MPFLPTSSFSAMNITEETLRYAEVLTAIGPDIVLTVEAVLNAHGISDPDQLIPALLSAAWVKHKEQYGNTTQAAFSCLLRSCADGIDGLARPH